MFPHGLLIKAAQTVFSGLVGVSAYEVVRKAVGSAPVHRASVGVTELGLRGGRRAEVAAESARVKLAGVVSEARERIGNDTAPTTAEHTTSDTKATAAGKEGALSDRYSTSDHHG